MRYANFSPNITLKLNLNLNLALCLCLFLSVDVFGEDLSGLLRRGDDCFANQETAEAVLCYDQAYAIAPRQNETLYRLVRAYNDLGWLHLRRDTSAETYYRRAAAFADTLLLLNPNMPSAHFWVALTRGGLIPFLSVKNKIRAGKEVRFHAEKAIELDSTFALAYVVLAVFERESSQLSWFERAIARVIFGEEIGGSLESSEAFLAKAIRYDPGITYTYYEMYRTYLAMGRNDEAEKSLRKLLTLPVRCQREGQQYKLAQQHLARLETETR